MAKRESRKGYHFYSTYLDCPRKWFIKYGLRLLPETTKRALIFGSALHTGLETLYLADDLSVAKADITGYLTEHQLDYTSMEAFQEDLARGPKMLESYFRDVLPEEKEHYRLIGLEVPFEIPVGPEEIDYSITVRVDKLLENKAGEIVIGDYKTTGWGVPRAIQSFECSDQLTAYVFAVDKVYPQRCIGGFVDVLYSRSSVFKSQRSEFIYRTKRELATFEQGFLSIMMEVTNKMRAFESGEYPDEFLFPRHGAFCGLFGCEYQDICRTKVKPGDVPPGYTYDDWGGFE